MSSHTARISSGKHSVYITDVVSILSENKLCFDVHFITKQNPKIQILRIYNIYVSFTLARPPGMTRNQFQRYIDFVINNSKTSSKDMSFKTFMHTDTDYPLKDGSYFNFDKPYDYMEIFSQNPNDLRDLQIKLEHLLITYYERIDEDKLPPWDAVFYRMTESPFGSTNASTHMSNTITILPVKYNIPLIGSCEFNFSNFNNKAPYDLYPDELRVQYVYGLNAQMKDYTLPNVNQNIPNSIVSINESFKQQITLLSYDIETYNNKPNLEEGDRPDPNNDNEYIFCIGIGIFNLEDPAPLKRYCIISKDFDHDPVSIRNSKPLPFEHKKNKYIVHSEYTDPDSEIENDYTTYIITKNEKDLLLEFIKIIDDAQPLFITGFNTYGFDDEYVYVRMQKFDLEKQFLQLYTYYTYSDPVDEQCGEQSGGLLERVNGRSKSTLWIRSIIPTFREFELKIDNEPRRDNKSVISPVVHNVDVFKLMLKGDPKRFTQHGRGNLDTMLDVYHILNPFNGEQLSKTGLKIYDMWKRWDENRDIYEIAIYCCQDAWITGTLLLKRSKLTDLIEMAVISNTSISDSILRADSLRVSNTLMKYSYIEGFTMQDEPYSKRKDVLDKPNTPKLGGKILDNRVIIGGAVRNVHAGKMTGVIAADFSAMYPSQVEGNTVSISSKVDPDILYNPSKYGLEVYCLHVNEVTGPRDIFYIKKL